MITDAALLRLRGHKQLSRLNVARTAISDAALQQLEATLPQAHHLLRQRAVDELASAGWTIEPHADPLAVNFTAASLHGKTSPEDLRCLSRLPGLSRLTCIGGSLTSECLDQIAQLKDLETLHLASDGLPKGGLARLNPLAKLRSLRLLWKSLDDEELGYISQFRELRELWLDGTEVTGLGLAHLQSLEHLESLELGGVRFLYDVDLEALYPLKSLRSLSIPNARVTEIGIANLERALPGIRVTRPKEPGLSEGPPADSDGATQAAFWSGRYDQLQQCLEAVGDTTDWRKREWLGHARQLAGDWAGAVQAYQEAIDLLGKEYARVSDRRERLVKAWPILVLLTGRAQLDALNEPAVAIETLKSGLRFVRAADRPVPLLAAEAVKYTDGLSSPHSNRKGTGQLWTQLMYPLATQRQLAVAYERTGDVAAAIECWTRVRLYALAYRAAMAETDPQHLAELWASMVDRESLPALPVFSVVSDQEQVVTLKPDSGSSRVTCWDTNFWNSFGLVPKPGYAIASMTFECEAGESEGDSALSCWVGGVAGRGSRDRVLLDEKLDRSGDSPTFGKPIAVDVEFDHDLLFVDIKNLRSVSIRATLRSRTGSNEDPEPKSAGRRLVTSEDFLPAGSPFHCLDARPREALLQLLAGSAVARLSDGRFIAAWGDDSIEIALSGDGKTWDGPFPYPYN
ncbi:MAG: hypothetical protein JJ992_27665, partial [Planctomycetes bacterium]|nr:hypothetical protein [Planctomycetota bacterium]